MERVWGMAPDGGVPKQRTATPNAIMMQMTRLVRSMHILLVLEYSYVHSNINSYIACIYHTSSLPEADHVLTLYMLLISCRFQLLIYVMC